MKTFACQWQYIEPDIAVKIFCQFPKTVLFLKKKLRQYLISVEECKKRWRGLRDGYMRSKRMGAIHKTKVGVFEKLQFLDGTSLDPLEGTEEVTTEDIMDEQSGNDDTIIGTEQVITDNQEYYEVRQLELVHLLMQ